MNDNEIVQHLALRLMEEYPDGDASETMIVERIIEALRAMDDGDRRRAVQIVDLCDVESCGNDVEYGRKYDLDGVWVGVDFCEEHFDATMALPQSPDLPTQGKST